MLRVIQCNESELTQKIVSSIVGMKKNVCFFMLNISKKVNILMKITKETTETRNETPQQKYKGSGQKNMVSIRLQTHILRGQSSYTECMMHTPCTH